MYRKPNALFGEDQFSSLTMLEFTFVSLMGKNIHQVHNDDDDDDGDADDDDDDDDDEIGLVYGQGSRSI